ncbi:transcriptional regulator GcvA [Variovorax sp. N23]|uniref:transcriptional regulator GcvA n=1 Tax=Variovorax sp. N23 TaxID=2980555 RepID=UPI0021C9D11C|nr:transcriptional regulator GcvA [Variovorax sp. N23]MCU4119040.1 transcriptional regulator GcvA [Variovorax sp. N23]
MTWQLPSLAALRTFEAAARHMSFTKAAEELHLTQSAVSRQIRTMEEYLGVLLFQRVKQRLVLTEVGRSYLIEIRSALEQMQEATVNLLAHRGRGGMLVLATPPAFATKWLIPRLADFYKLNPQIVINLVTRAKPFDFSTESIDAAIHYGNNDWPGVLSDRLMGDDVDIVCSLSYANVRPPIRNAKDLALHVLLQQSTRPHLWHDWMETRGVSPYNAWSGPRFEHFYMMMQAAIGGLGIALLPRMLVKDDLAEGRLIVPFDGSHKSRDAYCLVYPPEKRNDPKIEVFRRWLTGQSS